MSNASVDQVLSKLIEANLIRVTPGLSTTEDSLELAHESLLYGWSHFQALLETEQLNRYKRLRLTKDVEEWVGQGRPSDLLWRGVAIEEAEGYIRLSAAEIIFLSASREAALSIELERKSAVMQISDLSTRLKQMEEQNLSLEAQVRSLSSNAEKALMYRKKYRNLSASVILLLVIVITAVSLTAFTKSGINSDIKWTEDPIFNEN
jgi:hypothetical protein